MEVLAEGRRLGHLPRGHPLPDGRLYKFRTGVARVALRSGAPVYRSGWSAPATCSPRHRGAGTAHRSEVHFGAPLHFGDRAHEERSARVLREVTETVREAVQALSGQEYVDAYAGTSGAGVIPGRFLD